MELKKMVALLITAKPDQATAFYRDVLGFQFLKDDGFALVFDANGTRLRVGKAEQFTPAKHAVLSWEVEDIRAAVSALAGRGVVFERYPFMNPDSEGIHSFPTGDQVAWFKDPDGNVLSISRHVDAISEP